MPGIDSNANVRGSPSFPLGRSRVTMRRRAMPGSSVPDRSMRSGCPGAGRTWTSFASMSSRPSAVRRKRTPPRGVISEPSSLKRVSGAASFGVTSTVDVRPARS